MYSPFCVYATELVSLYTLDIGLLNIYYYYYFESLIDIHTNKFTSTLNKIHVQGGFLTKCICICTSFSTSIIIDSSTDPSDKLLLTPTSTQLVEHSL